MGAPKSNTRGDVISRTGRALRGDDSAKGDMLPQTRQRLEQFYSPFNERLAHMLGDERYLWR